MEKIYLRNAAIVKKVGDKLFIASEGGGVAIYVPNQPSFPINIEWPDLPKFLDK